MSDIFSKGYGGLDNVVVLDTDLSFQQYVQILRDPKTTYGGFTFTLKRAGRDMMLDIINKESTYEAEQVETLLSTDGDLSSYAEFPRIKENYVLVGIMRAAKPFAEGAEERLDEISGVVNRSWGIVDAKRVGGHNLTNELEGWDPGKNGGKDFEIEYTTWKIPKSNENSVIVILDPMFATASTMRGVINRFYKERDDGERDFKRIVSASLFSSRYALETMSRDFPDVRFYTGFVDTGGINGTGLNEKGFIVPGLGDAGDRTANTPSKEE